MFKRATEGSLSKFLLGYLRNVDFFTSWLEIVEALSSIGSQILGLHEHKVLHRYKVSRLEVHICWLANLFVWAEIFI